MFPNWFSSNNVNYNLRTAKYFNWCCENFVALFIQFG